MNKIEQNICEAIDIIVNKAISQANYDKTIEATIIKCIDQTIGKYSVKYQDSSFYAYSNDLNTIYQKGTNVYILIPSNDMNKEKTILGTTKKLGSNYIVVTEPDEVYDINGNNCINSEHIFGLSSYRENIYTKVLYHKDFNNNQNLIILNKTAINEYIKNSNTIICGAKIRTSLPIEQQYKGNYGIIFALDFIDNTNNEIVTRYYTVDIDKIVGNPYKLVYETRQYGIFDIDNINFKEVNYISIFTNNFPNSKPDNECIDDIFFSDIEFYGVSKLNDDDISNYSLSLITPQGTFFDNNSLDSDVRTLQAQVRVKGKVIDNNSQPLSFYWFTENVGITSKSQYYNKYGGQGWKCLNNFNIIKPATDTDSAIVEWIPSSYQWIIKKSDIIAKEVKYKCVAIYNGTVISKKIIIKNFSSNYNITIESDSGTQFYFDIGFPTLTCLVNGESLTNYSYSWAVTNNVGTFQSLPETLELNNNYNNINNEYNSLLNSINNELIPYEPNKNKLQALEEELNSYNKITRIDKNNIYHLNINTITNFSNYQCTVYYNDIYLGTASITLTNSLKTEGSYSLIINNSSYVYKYNENGISPASKALDSYIDIKALTFTIYDNLGQPIDDEITRHCNIKWIVPFEDTLINIPDSYKPSNIDLINKNNIYNNFMSFSYLISDKYDITKTRNNIKLIVNYKGLNLAAETDLTFIKEGESGTNGTEFICKIVPNVESGSLIPIYPVITYNNINSYNINYNPIKSNTFFRVQLWHNENKILDSVTSTNSTEGKSAVINWSILKNKYTSIVSDVSSLDVSATTGVFTINNYTDDSPANIVKATVTYDGVTYHATIPVITVKINNNNYKINLKEGTGFRYAIYSSDGQRPQYDNTNPFELIITQNINGYDEDISLKTSSAYKVTYDWDILGKIYEENTWINSINLSENSLNKIQVNQKSIKPLDNFDGQCVTNAIRCIIFKSNNEIGRIHIPIHLLLNKYGNSAINGWDGNSVNIDTEGGFILSPQVGAGIKEKDNSFTGVIMGKVKETNKSTEDIGLIGYSKGARSIFLDSKTGKSLFGVSGKGQIVVDPSNNKAQLYSGNYNTSEKTGMLIDLTTPEIRFGSGNFIVNKNGNITAKGGGTLAGWSIDDDSLFTSTKNDSSNVRFSSIDFNRNINGVNYNSLRLVLGTKFAVSNNGILYAGDAIIGTGTNKITIGRSSNNNLYSAIYSGNKTSLDANANGFYIGTDGIALGSYNGENSTFQVTNAGQLIARSGYIGNGSSGWTIGSNYLTNGKQSYSDNNNGVFLGTSGIGLGAGAFYVTSSGHLHATLGNIAGWELSSTKLQNNNGTIYIGTSGIKFGDNFNVTSDGTLSCSNAKITGSLNTNIGTIGGWTINENGLTNGTMYIYANGSIGGSNWSISPSGIASFNNANITGGSVDISSDNANFKVDSNGTLIATGVAITGDISATSFDFNDGEGHYMTMGVTSQHPTVSGLNVFNGGIAMHGWGISRCRTIGNIGEPIGELMLNADLTLTAGENTSIDMKGSPSKPEIDIAVGETVSIDMHESNGESRIYIKAGDSANNIIIATSKGWESLGSLIQRLIDESINK